LQFWQFLQILATAAPRVEIVQGLIEALRRVVGGILLPHDCHGEVSDGGMLQGLLYLLLFLCREGREGCAFAVSGVMPF
jgi:hypothetical protein